MGVSDPYWLVGMYYREDAEYSGVHRRPRWGSLRPTMAMYVTDTRGDGLSQQRDHRHRAVRFASLAAARREADRWQAHGTWYAYVLRVYRRRRA